MFSITDESKINISAEILSVLGRSFGCSQSDFSINGRTQRLWRAGMCGILL